MRRGVPSAFPSALAAMPAAGCIGDTATSAAPASANIFGSPLAARRSALAVGEHRYSRLVFEIPQDPRPVRLHCTVGTAERRWIQ
ncbi:hypothetical protein J7E88_06885 [Streptomyces sp. ISL-10]|uniref:hypothetical protein n=1 Tax=Streptomyces sp. ISL-10 TaxID=2819172 RepID=UPI001BE79BEB|nr:hypothetical protein [Streptomyces sp. ISL-10]MBT2365049.1 hypothetical protein [Streptomyces sp. ISL-10]